MEEQTPAARSRKCRHDPVQVELRSAGRGSNDGLQESDLPCALRARCDMGFDDSFNASRDWIAEGHLAIDQGPIVVMIENCRSALLWRLFMSCPEVAAGLQRLGFTRRTIA